MVQTDPTQAAQVIEPTVNRHVDFYPAPTDDLSRFGMTKLAAVITEVHDTRLVNVAVFDPNGTKLHGRTSIALVQEGDPEPTGQSFVAWMPYQLGQAARTQQAEQSSVGDQQRAGEPQD